jgi:hypothetical protein
MVLFVHIVSCYIFCLSAALYTQPALLECSSHFLAEFLQEDEEESMPEALLWSSI